MSKKERKSARPHHREGGTVHMTAISWEFFSQLTFYWKVNWQRKLQSLQVEVSRILALRKLDCLTTIKAQIYWRKPTRHNLTKSWARQSEKGSWSADNEKMIYWYCWIIKCNLFSLQRTTRTTQKDELGQWERISHYLPGIKTLLSTHTRRRVKIHNYKLICRKTYNFLSI